MNNLPEDIIIVIWKYLSLNELVQSTQINKYFNRLIKNTKWEHLIVYPTQKKY